ncbi:MAG: Acylphosphatase [Methanomassiliicoccales archaeon PtaU1.Bin124]|nr:MAG: Acylphosphatase [Methanomassiliicoccales archaeon PtaU1.Bin124]
MRIVIYGIVQGVGFRPTVHRIAVKLGVHGYVQNNGSNVVIEVTGDPDVFLQELKASLPPLARMDRVEIGTGRTDEELERMGFVIVQSQSGSKGVAIPTDTAVCENCAREMFDPKDRRYLFPFTNCTDCGARFTIIEDLPYDRDKTTMREFPMCDDCRREYLDPSNRRFHHQTISCPRCGPRYYLLNKDGKELMGEPVDGFAKVIEAGGIGIIKSWGGMHICASLDNLPHLRTWYHRAQKPFAIMVRDLEAVRKYAAPTVHEIELLTSGHRPIVLVRKRDGETTDLISPGLGNIGIFLPYTEMQRILFKRLKVDALIMTSANVPGEPMVLRDEEALTLGADVYLMHDRAIINRCDDSVVRSHNGHISYIRRSRGSVPFDLPFPLKGSAIGLGAQENIAGSLAFNGRLHCTQYIGDSASAGVLEFLRSALEHLRTMIGAERIDAIGIDLHPAYSTRRLGMQMAKELDANVVEVQHHWAHALALMLERKRSEMVVIAIDGTGYGTDGKAWGGEVLDSTFDGFERVGHLQELPLLGGEKAVHDVRRLVYAARKVLGREGGYFTEEERTLFDKMMPKSTSSTGLGRVLDATACALDICQYRSYDGEPAMKLERWLEEGRVDRRFAPIVQEGVVRSVDMFSYVLDQKGKKQDIAATYVNSVVRGLVQMAAERAREKGAEDIGLTGGVSYNSTIVRWVEEAARENGLTVLLPEELPNGDGCISAGQCLAALATLR